MIYTALRVQILSNYNVYLYLPHRQQILLYENRFWQEA